MKTIFTRRVNTALTVILVSLISTIGVSQTTQVNDTELVQSLNIHNAVTLLFDKNLILNAKSTFEEKTVPYVVDDAEFEAMMKNGAILNTEDESLDIIGDQVIQYQRLEIIETSTNKLIISQNLGTTNPKVKLSNITTGNYTLILTNDNGDIKVEQLIIASQL